MKLTVWRPTEVDVADIVVSVPLSCFDDDVPDQVAKMEVGGRWVISIGADGRVYDWPGGKMSAFVKVVDEGMYELIGESGESVALVAGYVPECVPGQYGDYLDFDIDESGRVAKWADYFTPCNVRFSFFPVPGRQP